jgi:sugar phosphate isomerase/epimerase
MGDRISRFVHVSIPYVILRDGFVTTVIERGINPEVSFDSEALDSLDIRVLTSMTDAIRQRGLTITLHAPFMDMAPGSPDPLVRAVVRRRLEQMLDVARIAGPISIVCHAAYEERRYRHMRDAWLENSLSLWRWFSSSLAQCGSRLALENVFEGCPEELKDLFSALSEENVGFCLDVGHQSAFSFAPLDRWLDVLGPFIAHLHLHDNMGRADDHLAIGKGKVDFSLLFSWLKTRCIHRPVVTIEPHVREDVDISLEALERLWPW